MGKQPYTGTTVTDIFFNVPGEKWSSYITHRHSRVLSFRFQRANISEKCLEFEVLVKEKRKRKERKTYFCQKETTVSLTFWTWKTESCPLCDGVSPQRRPWREPSSWASATLWETWAPSQTGMFSCRTSLWWRVSSCPGTLLLFSHSLITIWLFFHSWR